MKVDRTKHSLKRHASAIRERPNGAANIDRHLGGILRDLARILVSSGYGISSLNRLAKRAYFDAAVELDSAAGRRINLARIAATTGLTRAEASSLSHARKPAASPLAPIPANRAQRVSWAWISDSDYCDSKGRPTVLPFAGKKRSFERLVKCYSGDIPARAMFAEMFRLGMVREVEDRKVSLIRADAPVSRQTKASLRALSPWMSFLSQSEQSSTSELNANSLQFSLGFDSLPQLFAAVRALQSRASAFVESAQELGERKKPGKPYKLDVSFALGTRISNVKDEPQKRLRKNDG